MRFLIVDDDFGSRGGMGLTLQAAYPGCEILETAQLSAALALLAEQPAIDLLLLDLNLADSKGMATLHALKAWCERQDRPLRILVVSAASDHDDTLIPQTLEHCASGFISKGTSEAIFRQAIALTLAGSIFIPEQYLRSRRPPGTPALGAGGADMLTARERQVAALLTKGLTYKQIARRLEQDEPGRAMSDNTVRVHVQRMAWKLRLNGHTAGDGLSARSALVTALADPQLRLVLLGSGASP